MKTIQKSVIYLILKDYIKNVLSNFKRMSEDADNDIRSLGCNQIGDFSLTINEDFKDVTLESDVIFRTLASMKMESANKLF